MRVVVDTNVLISAALSSSSAPRQALDRVLHDGILLISDNCLEELAEKLHHPKLARYLDAAERDTLLRLIHRVAVRVVITEPVTACRDSKDDKFLELAVNGAAECLVTGDADLLVLHPFRGVQILSPRQFLDYPTQ
ncbi:putative toxin-antitoxin system toxin component, PIN family [Magnetofaba australis]|uniref:Putative twitching motility protein PilT n=1 Tax=Magnetofaba australis IT-1 TaxID=1434232 RepID=A0A1Y2K3L6_9PROT|nr:putative toxin-antitoxin system toxin component, PIN family [Magnetofaba australis]OSM03948.1 putative twitching motility protein PilT [Magnetofaba australis IT-1]